MIAMARKYLWRKSADRSLDPDKLYRRILIAAIWIALLRSSENTLSAEYRAADLAVSNNFLIIAFVACN